MPDRPITREFHISREARTRYQFEESLYALSGNVILPNFHAVRVFAHKMNEQRDLVRFPEQAIQASQLNVMGLLDEISHLVIEQYRQQKNPGAFAQAVAWLEARVGREAVDAALRRFVTDFPPLAVFQGKVSTEEYLQGQTGGTPNREVALEEMLTLWLSNANPAFKPFRELFDDTRLEKETAYREVLASLHNFFDTQPRFGPDNQNLIDMLRAPALASPHSLTGQLEFIRDRWGHMLGRYFYRLLSSLDLIAEEQKAGWAPGGRVHAPVPIYAYGAEAEPERFSLDRDWMPELVLLAKNIYVWLDQLSKKYSREIRWLSQVPDEELDELARRGISGLWMIGLWERSLASQRIKQMMGNPNAAASAYSIFEYQIAAALGGEEAYQNLRERAWRRRIRLASDMVPNHMGIDSRWVVEHPDWFISLDYSPFPSYSFNGPNLSWDNRVGIYLEDHYYSRSDAAVVFKRVDHWTGDAKYIYHGNDGTSMPWNDTAQLNYLKAEVREAAIQSILHVVRKFPIIRFDAAMTLAKRHYQRLWFPEPGTGGAIPSRAEHGLTKEQFDQAMPEEFWRMVVDRVAAEAPDTLLLAEAFWLMEGYFVRTLGMHRVYNSAFMNMLRDEENANYRSTMKNTLEFDPEVLKRFVNFMNNPDEETAVAQFGKGDKYFGIAVMMSTLPGLPMFGHGQIEGFTERYGMEYYHAYWNEQPDQELIYRHEREIFPLLHRRYLFAEVKDFLLYDFYSPEGYVNEDVFAYSNRAGEERTLVAYHNRFATARGWIRTSVAYRDKSAGEGKLVQKSLGEGLGLHADDNYFTIFADHVSGLEYLRSSKDLCERGLYIELDAYKYHVFVNIREVQDNEWHQYAHLNSYLNGRGVPSVDEALREVFLQPILNPFKEVVNAEMFRRLESARPAKSDEVELLLDEFADKYQRLLEAARDFIGGAGNLQTIARQVRGELAATLHLPQLPPAPEGGEGTAVPPTPAAVQYLQELFEDTAATWGTLLGWVSTHALGRIAGEDGYEEQSRSYLDEWLLGRMLERTLQEFGLDQGAAQRAVLLIKILASHQRWYEQPASSSSGDEGESAYRVLQGLLRDGEVQQFLQFNRYQDILWFNKESLEQLLWWLLATAVAEIRAQEELDREEQTRAVDAAYDLIAQFRQAEEQSGYQVEKLLEGAREHQ